MNRFPVSFNRREFAKCSAAAVACGGQLVRAAESDEPNYIDAHVHVWTDDTKSYPLAAGFTESDMRPKSFTPQELFSHCRPCGVARIVLIQMSYYQTDNSYMLAAMRDFPGVFAGVGIVDEHDNPVEHMKRLAEKGVRGFRIRPKDRSPDRWLESENMQNMWRYGAANKLALCHLIDAKYLASVDRMCRKHPDTPVVIDHFARIGIDGQIRESDVAALCRLAKWKNTHVKVSAFYALGKKKAPYDDLIPMIRRVLDAFGPERLMWASDGPFQVVDGHEYKPSIDLIRSGIEFLSSTEKDWLLRKTAEKVYFPA